MQGSPRAAHGLPPSPIGGGGGGQGGAGGDGVVGWAGGGDGGLGGVHSEGHTQVGEVKHGCGTGLHSACACPHCLKQPNPSVQHLCDHGASMQDA